MNITKKICLSFVVLVSLHVLGMHVDMSPPEWDDFLVSYKIVNSRLPGKKGNTLLHELVEQAHRENSSMKLSTITKLLYASANPLIPNDDGITALDLVKKPVVKSLLACNTTEAQDAYKDLLVKIPMKQSVL